MPEIAVINRSHAIPDPEISKMVPAFEQQWNRDLAPIWGVDAAKFTFLGSKGAPPPASWWVVFLDNSDQAGALAYHDLTNEGLPLSKVFVKTLNADHADVGVGATHEICEMAVDPWLNSAYQDRHGVFWAGEVCDPVEKDAYGYRIGDTLVTDFVTPDWFAHPHSGSRYDFQRHCHKPFEVLSEGYAQQFDPNRGWVQVNGSKVRATKTAPPPYWSRRAERIRQATAWQASKATF